MDAAHGALTAANSPSITLRQYTFNSQIRCKLSAFPDFSSSPHIASKIAERLSPGLIDARRNCGFAVRNSVSTEGGELPSAPSGAEKPKTVRKKKPAVDLPSPTRPPIPALADDDPAKEIMEMAELRSVADYGVKLEGVAKIDDNSQLGVGQQLIRAGLLAGGDVLVLILFAWIGRATHVSPALDWSLIKTAEPFVDCWLFAAFLLGDYGVSVLPKSESDPPAAGAKAAALAAVKTWALGVPAGIVFRSFLKGQLPPPPFIVVSMASTAVLMIGWRAAFGEWERRKLEDMKTTAMASGNKKGDLFEFFELLTSLVRRW
eukprot:TRINITY_DN2091_c0_g1_i1.p1 TRINITY_DN2091_c0_g1~~TRINITY_DN2091_c0_g1_i1.p1  ORF type:complete len:318 (-),score=60.16 TRINITY_DN2091_c0_g1_i1:246-1199(-)